MTSKERFLTAMTGGIPDRVPVAPDISNYIPVKRTGRPFWEIYFSEEVPLWRAYVDAADYFGIDHWIASCTSAPMTYKPQDAKSSTADTYVDERDAMVRRIDWVTPDGPLSQEEICFRGEPPTHLSRPIKSLESDWKKYRHLLRTPNGILEQEWLQMELECKKRDQAFGVNIGYPGFQAWEAVVQGSIEQLTYCYADNPEILEEWRELEHENGSRAMELIIEHRPDYILFGGSGTLTLASPELARRYALPSLIEWSAMAHEAGIPTLLHSCGRSRALVDMLAEETDIDCVNPLEIPPMGDVDLAEVKLARGKEISLMGNLHTTEVMLFGSPDDVYAASRDAILAAGENGGFILSTGDQCPRETPDENLRAMVRAAQDFGRYDQKTGRLLSAGA